jgi:hypothetical protein
MSLREITNFKYKPELRIDFRSIWLNNLKFGKRRQLNFFSFKIFIYHFAAPWTLLPVAAAPPPHPHHASASRLLKPVNIRCVWK